MRRIETSLKKPITRRIENLLPREPGTRGSAALALSLLSGGLAAGSLRRNRRRRRTSGQSAHLRENPRRIAISDSGAKDPFAFQATNQNQPWRSAPLPPS